MARVAGINIPDNKHIQISLTYIFGIGKTRALGICDQLGISPSTKISDLTGKPENYVMTLLQINIPMTFAGTLEPCCYIEVKSIGSLIPKAISKQLCENEKEKQNLIKFMIKKG